jgi:MFS family permease
MASSLSPYRLGKARDVYNVYTALNSFSWQFLVGNVLTLFALRLKANSTYIGLITALVYISYFFLPLGKILSRHFSIVKVFSTAWIARSLGMLPIIAAPFLIYSGQESLALVLVLIGASIFHTARGIGMIANNPVLSFLATGPDRGSYMTLSQIINNAVSMFAGFIIAILLGRAPPPFLYAIIFGTGIVTGIMGGLVVRKVPEPASEESGKRVRLFHVAKEALSNPSLRLFVIILLLVALISGVSRAFVVVYSREVYLQSDGMVSLYAVFGGLGVLMIGLMVKFLVDRIGAKPIFIMSVIIGLVSLVPVLFMPIALSDTTIVLYLSALFFIMNFGFLGSEGIAQTYFMGLVPSGKMVDMSILYFFCFAIAGTAGSFLAGVFLDAMAGVGLSPLIAFRLLFLILTILTVLVLFLQKKLVPLGAMPFMGALGVLFSPRDLKAISLMEKLNRASDSHKEEALLEALHDTPSRLSIKALLNRAKSPRLATRLEALRAIDALKMLDEPAERALMDDIIHNPYTTAYNSARILGNHGIFSAIPLLRKLASSKDYMLSGEAMIALARLSDHAFRPRIEKIIAKTRNPRLKIMGVEALGIYGSPNSLSALLDILRGANPPPYLRDEVVLAMASILDIQNYFYPLLVRFLSDETQVITLAMDEAESAYEFFVSIHGRKRIKKDSELAALSRQAKILQSAVSEFMSNSKGARLSRWILEIPEDLAHTIVQMVLSETVLDDELAGHRRLRLLIVHWAAHELRLWVNKLKN